MTHNILRCELWLDTLIGHVEEAKELFRWGLEVDVLESIWMSVFFPMGFFMF